MKERLILPHQTLLVLCGPSGSGKSTFAEQRFPATTIVSTDHCRGMICDDESDQTANEDTFELFCSILNKRMRHGRFCIADSVALKSTIRREMRDISRHYGYYGCLLILDTPPEICIQRDRQRTRQVGESVVNYHIDLFSHVFDDAPKEGWEKIHVVHEDERTLEIIFEE
jgi:predicted kinase